MLVAAAKHAGASVPLVSTSWIFGKDRPHTCCYNDPYPFTLCCVVQDEGEIYYYRSLRDSEGVTRKVCSYTVIY